MIEKRKIYFRADAGPEIGYGHYIRSLALADMLKQDFDCTMFTQNPTEYQLCEAKDICTVIALPADETRFDKFLTYLTGEEIVVLDNYFYTTDYQRMIKAMGCKLVCIDDMHDKHYVADVVINHCVENQSLFHIEDYTKLCLGISYSLLRRPFWRQIPNNNRVPNSYAICFGGADYLNLTQKYVKYLLNNNNVQHIVAIVGDGYAHEMSLCISPKVSVEKKLNAYQIAEVFSTVKNVVCSSSSISYEAISCGANVYSGWYVSNQRMIYEMWRKKGCIIPLGNLQDMHMNQVFTEYHQTVFTFPDFVNNIKTIFRQFL